MVLTLDYNVQFRAEELLKKAEKELPELSAGNDRFVLEKIKGHLEGNKTVLVNLKKIAKDIGREENHLLKYLLRELAAPGKIFGGRVILGTKISAAIINSGFILPILINN